MTNIEFHKLTDEEKFKKIQELESKLELFKYVAYTYQQKFLKSNEEIEELEELVFEIKESR